MKKIIFTLTICLIALMNLDADATKYTYNTYLGNPDFASGFYDTLVYPEDYLLINITRKIDLISKSEYDNVENFTKANLKKTSYLNNGKETFTKTTYGANQVYYLDSLSETTTLKYYSDEGNIKGTMYVLPETKVVGVGTKADPYKFVGTNDLNVTNIYIDGEKASGTPTTGNYTMQALCSGIDSKDVTWDNAAYQVIFDSKTFLPPVTCQLWFKTV